MSQEKLKICQSHFQVIHAHQTEALACKLKIGKKIDWESEWHNNDAFEVVPDSCEFCKFFIAGECRINAPLPVSNEIGSGRYFPNVNKEDWCGQFSWILRRSA